MDPGPLCRSLRQERMQPLHQRATTTRTIKIITTMTTMTAMSGTAAAAENDGPMGKLMEAEPLAGIVTMQFLKHLMDLNPALRPPIKRVGLDELELWESLWTSVYASPFDAMLSHGTSQDQPRAELPSDLPSDPNSGGSVIGEALLWTLDSCFREDFTPEARAAWETLYRFVNQAV